jgi:CRP-like cAMP-binding protein
MDQAVVPSPIVSLLFSCRLFKGLSGGALRILAQSSRLSSFERGQNIFLRDLAEPGLFLVKSGRVKLSLLSARGSERVIDVVNASGTFGEIQLFSTPHRPRPCLNAEMLDNAELVEISRHALIQAMAQSPNFSLALLNHFGTKLCGLVNELETCCLRTARERIIDYLLTLVDEQQQAGAEAAEVRLPANKGIVASLLDLTPETFSREMKRLSRQGLIEMDRRTIVIPAVKDLRQAVC